MGGRTRPRARAHHLVVVDDAHTTRGLHLPRLKRDLTLGVLKVFAGLGRARRLGLKPAACWHIEAAVTPHGERHVARALRDADSGG
eukprot:6863645-Prymnesium_polylepis.2